jgi:hypothetical protein
MRGRRKAERERACIGGTTTPPFDVEVDPQRRRFCRRESEFALQALVEGRAAKTEHVRAVLRWHSCGSEVRLGVRKELYVRHPSGPNPRGLPLPHRVIENNAQAAGPHPRPASVDT